MVAVDDEDGTVELQHFDGTIEEMEFDVWQDTDLEPVEAPEDWSGSVDVDVTDMPDPELVAGLGWQDPLVIIDNSE